MRRAFSLVELLVVIAILAILAALLFPLLFAAKDSAKQASSLSNLRQLGLAMQLYLADTGDVYPRQDGCMAPDTVPWNPNAVGCQGVPGFGQRVNHFKWVWWLYPYTKSAQIYRSPGREADPVAFAKDAEFRNAYALNTAITGMTNDYPTPATVGAYRDSYLGGTSSSVPSPDRAVLFIEFFHKVTWAYLTPFGSAHQEAWPLATREVWSNYLLPGGKLEMTRAPRRGGFLASHVDTSVRYYTVGRWLANSPPAMDYLVVSPPSTFPVGTTWTIASRPVVNGDWPMWGLER